jgi:hypothetical protein
MPSYKPEEVLIPSSPENDTAKLISPRLSIYFPDKVISDFRRREIEEAKKTLETKYRFAKLQKVLSVAMIIFGGLSQISGVEEIKPKGGITFLPQPKFNQSIKNKKLEVQEQFAQAKSTGSDRVAVQLPNNLPKKEAVAFLEMVGKVAKENKILPLIWESNWIGGSKIPLNDITMKLIKEHPDWFLHSKDGKTLTGYESGAKCVYPNPLSKELSIYVDSLRREYSDALKAKGLVADDLALPINNDQKGSREIAALEGIPFENASKEEINDPRLTIYKERLKALRNFTKQIGIPLSLSAQNNTDSTNFFGFQQAQNIGIDEIIPQIYAQNNPELFDSQLKRTSLENNKTDGKIKITPVLFAGNNSLAGLQAMSSKAKESFESQDVGIFPIAGIVPLAKKDPKGVKSIFKK